MRLSTLVAHLRRGTPAWVVVTLLLITVVVMLVGTLCPRGVLRERAKAPFGPMYASMSSPGVLQTINRGEDNHQPMMYQSDITTLLMTWFGGAKTYLEFGAGGSTIMVHRAFSFGATVERMAVIEGSPTYMQKVLDIIYKERQTLPPEARERGLLPTHVIIPVYGPIGKFSTPLEPKEYAGNLPSYARSVDLVPFVPDFILIDGRFRVACALRSILRWGSYPLMVIDDFLDRKDEYDAILPFVDIILDTLDTAAHKMRRALVFRGKPLSPQERDAMATLADTMERIHL